MDKVTLRLIRKNDRIIVKRGRGKFAEVYYNGRWVILYGVFGTSFYLDTWKECLDKIKWLLEKHYTSYPDGIAYEDTTGYELKKFVFSDEIDSETGEFMFNDSPFDNCKKPFILE